MPESMQDLADKGLVSSRLRAMQGGGAQTNAATPYANIPKDLQAPQQPPRDRAATEYANIPEEMRREKLAFEQNDRSNPSGPKQQGSVELPERWTGKGSFVANTNGGLLFKMQGREMNDGLVKFTPEQTKALLQSDRDGLIEKSLHEGREAGPVTVGFRKDGAQADWRVSQPQHDQPHRGGRK